MSLAKDLMQVGIPAEAAVRVGFEPATLVAAGTTNADATILKKSQTLVTGTGATGAGFKMPSDAELGVPYVIANIAGNVPLVYPPTGGQINGDTVTTGTVSLAARATVILIRLDTVNWCAVLGAAT
jgi:hypothetical protein